MGYDAEDEVDWSDGPLEDSSFSPRDCDHAAQEENDSSPTLSPLMEPEEDHHWNLPLGIPLPSHPAATPASSRFGLSRQQRVKVGVRFNHRQPTKEDYAHFALYQASQKTYEAVFLRTFLAHALHPHQLRRCFSEESEDENRQRVEMYLQSVSTDINQIVTKMVWNAHSRTVNILANDEKPSAHFWDFRRFDKYPFSDYSPDNIAPVAHKLNESWHRAFNNPPMIRFTSKDYPVGNHISPIEEIDEVAETLFKPRHLDDTLSAGRPVKFPSKRKKGDNLRANALRAERAGTSRGHWMEQLMTGSTPKDFRDGQEYVNPHAQADHSISIESTDAVEDGLFLRDREPMEIDEHSHAMSRHSESRKDTPHGESTMLEALVRQHGPDFLLDASDTIAKEEASALRTSKEAAVRAKILEHQRRRVAELRSAPRKRPKNTNPTIKTIISRAVKQGILKPPTPENQKKINIAARIELAKRQAFVAEQMKAKATTGIYAQEEQNATPLEVKSSVNARKKQKRALHPEDVSLDSAGSLASVEGSNTPSPHPSGSKTLEQHQVMPPDAYFERISAEEKPVWRCGIKHPMGHYYNAGDRKNCAGCFTAISHNPKARHMDFYLPSKTYHYQPAPGVRWKPSKDHGKERRSKHLSHNSIAKEAFWRASRDGATDEEALQEAIEAVEEHLRPKPPPEKPREPTPEPPPEPIDLGPHPSGSKMMEHGQDLPERAYWEATEEGEPFAWRCDSNHAFGRYYLAGDKNSCPGCGSSRKGEAKKAEMDFYLPSGVVVRQAAPGLSNWKPRQPNKIKSGKKPNKGQAQMSHNQLCSRKYYAAIDDGQEPDEAMAFTIREIQAELEAHVEAKMKAVRKKEETATRPAPKKAAKSSGKSHKSSVKGGDLSKAGKSPEEVNESEEEATSDDSESDAESLATTQCFSNELSDDEMAEARKQRMSRGVVLPSAGGARKRSRDEMNENEDEDDVGSVLGQDDGDGSVLEDVSEPPDQDAISISSGDDSLSDSDSE
ncbi:hypothetical protein CC80DRAFT_551216 [Byssothecium circinans]|uniref:Uncharacterized protein n=1 Tax=Byssothecium circinans TaxID=147558 RepID=A0A6A5TNN4_9PLEO|nr:hypothetical protein CC80DRAFT_551216 [Byssothecium circinans]